MILLSCIQISPTDDIDLIKIANFNENEKIFASQFFEFCFVKRNCPRIMWIYTLRLFQQIDESILILIFFD